MDAEPNVIDCRGQILDYEHHIWRASPDNSLFFSGPERKLEDRRLLDTCTLLSAHLKAPSHQTTLAELRGHIRPLIERLIAYKRHLVICIDSRQHSYWDFERMVLETYVEPRSLPHKAYWYAERCRLMFEWPADAFGELFLQLPIEIDMEGYVLSKVDLDKLDRIYHSGNSDKSFRELLEYAYIAFRLAANSSSLFVASSQIDNQKLRAVLVGRRSY